MWETEKTIRQYLVRRGISQAYVCKKTGMKTTHLSAALRCKRKLSVGELALICGALGVTANRFCKPVVLEQEGNAPTAETPKRVNGKQVKTDVRENASHTST